MKKFRVKNLTVAVDATKEARAHCGVNFSCPGGPAGSFCGITNNCGVTFGCNSPTNNCGVTFGCNFPTNCGVTFGCNFPTNGCLFTPNCLGITQGGCGLNISTLPPTEITELIQPVDPVDRAELVATLKTDLNLALEQLELAEKQIEADAQPQNLEEVNELEANLESALKEVKDMKNQFK
jgi:hypothetical protein